MQIVINGELCTGQGRCYTVAPTVFQSDDDGYGHVKAEMVPTDLEDEAKLGLASCPERAITVN